MPLSSRKRRLAAGNHSAYISDLVWWQDAVLRSCPDRRAKSRSRWGLGMLKSANVTDRLDSWKEIAAYIGRDVRTVNRWERQRGLPVHRVPGGGRQVVFAYPDEIDEWLKNGHGAPSEDGAHGALPDTTASTTQQAPEKEGTALTLPVDLAKKLLFSGIAIVLLLLAAFAVLRIVLPKQILLDGEIQITDDGAHKVGLVTDGSKLYFGEQHEGRILLSSVSSQGDNVEEIQTPFVQAEPVAITSDGQKLLILAGEGMERERALWIVHLRGGSPQRVGAVLCHSAAWSPNGKEIAYASGNAIYLTADNGISTRSIQHFAGVPQQLHWSIDGKRILFLLRDMATWKTALWKIDLDDSDHFVVTAVIPLIPGAEQYGNISSPFDNDDGTFVGIDGIHATILALIKSSWPWSHTFKSSKFADELNGVESLAVDTSAHRLYLLRSAHGHDEVVLFDKQTRKFLPFLPGVWARDVDFSKDGRWIVYVREPGGILCVANAHGGPVREIDTSGIVSTQLPRWSPDGKQIAFMGRRPDKPWRIYVTPAAGGGVREASIGTDSQGAPTWSPDGRSLVYGRVECQEENTCAVGEIDLKAGQQSVIQGSEGLSTARWSPDGRYIAALRDDKYQVVLLDRRTGKWRKLADGVNGNDLAWAPDSKTLYASRPGGDRPEVLRISLSRGKVEPAVDLTDFSKMSGRIDTWFAITPNGSILFVREVSGNDVYALHYTQK